MYILYVCISLYIYRYCVSAIVVEWLKGGRSFAEADSAGSKPTTRMTQRPIWINHVVGELFRGIFFMLQLPHPNINRVCCCWKHPKNVETS